MKIPTIKQFNGWSADDKLWLIDLETGGSFKFMKRSQGYFPIIIYDSVNVGIVYQVNDAGQIAEADAMTITEAFDRLHRFERASKAMTAKN